MSVEEPPNPVLTVYEPWNWVKPYVLYNQKVLNQAYITYKTAQSYAITFVNSVNVPSHLIAGDYIANTSDVVAYWASILTSFFERTDSWTSTQTMPTILTNILNAGTIVVNTISASIINLLGTTLNLTNPMKPIRTYDFLAGFPSQGTTVTANRVGTIGYCIGTRGTDQYLNATTSIASLSLSKGTWFVYGEYQTDTSAINTVRGGIGLNTTTNSFVGGFGIKQFVTLAALTTPRVPSALTTSGFITLNSTTTVYLVGNAASFGYQITRIYFFACRVS